MGQVDDLADGVSGLVAELLSCCVAGGRCYVAQKPWMFPTNESWPAPEERLDPYGIWISEMLRCSAALISYLDPMDGSPPWLWLTPIGDFPVVACPIAISPARSSSHKLAPLAIEPKNYWQWSSAT